MSKWQTGIQECEKKSRTRGKRQGVRRSHKAEDLGRKANSGNIQLWENQRLSRKRNLVFSLNICLLIWCSSLLSHLPLILNTHLSQESKEVGLLHVGYIMNKQGENPQMELIQLKQDFRNRHPWVLTTSSSCLQARTEIWGDCFNFYRTLKGTWKSGCNWLNLIYILRGLVSSGVCIATSLLFRNNSPTTCILWVILKCFPVYCPLFSVFSFYQYGYRILRKSSTNKNIYSIYVFIKSLFWDKLTCSCKKQYRYHRYPLPSF